MTPYFFSEFLRYEAIIICASQLPLIPNHRVGLVENHLRWVFSNNNSLLISHSVQPDHVHLFFKLGPNITADEMMLRAKLATAAALHQAGHAEFYWQGGYYLWFARKVQFQRIPYKHLKQKEYHRKISLEKELSDLRKKLDLVGEEQVYDLHEAQYN